MAIILVIGGLPGSGKTTVAEGVAQRKGWGLVSAGTLFRRMAEERSLSLEALGDLAEADHAIDRRLDETVLERVKDFTARGDPVVVEGRLPAYLLPERGEKAFAVWLEAPRDLRVERVARREGQGEEVAGREMERREESEARRYAAIYGIDPTDLAVFDLLLDTSVQTPRELVNRILEEADL